MELEVVDFSFHLMIFDIKQLYVDSFKLINFIIFRTK